MPKSTVEDYTSLGISFFRKHGYLGSSTDFEEGNVVWSRNGEQIGTIHFRIYHNERYIQLDYTSQDRSTGEMEEKDYPVHFTTTRCHLGGVRYWFVCPWCSERVGALYFSGNSNLQCRHCLNLSYKSRNDKKRFRGLGKLLNVILTREKIFNLRMKNYKRLPTKRFMRLIDRMNRFTMQIPEEILRG